MQFVLTQIINVARTLLAQVSFRLYSLQDFVSLWYRLGGEAQLRARESHPFGVTVH